MRIPHSLKIETTNICNADCIFCPYRHVTRKQGIMSMELFQKAVTEYCNLGGRRVHLCPVVGEVLVDSNFLDKLRYAASFNLTQLDFHSNLIALDEWSDDEVQEMLNLATRPCVSLGPNRETYKLLFGIDRFEIVLESLERLYVLNNSTRILIRGRSLEGSNVDPRLVDIIGDVDWLTEYWNWGGVINDARLTYIPLANRSVICSRRSYQLPIFWDGKVGAFPCFDYDAKFAIGDLNKDSLKDILKSKELEDLVRATKKCKHDNLYCKRCNY